MREIARRVRAGEASAREICEEHLARAEAGASLGAFWHLDARGARAAAVAIDRDLARGVDPGPLAGVPVAVKDAFAVAGMPGGGGGPVVSAARRDATAVRRLRRAGAVVLGKLAMHQLGWGMSGQTPGRAPCRNPLDPTTQPGGSSSGSAVAVAAGMVALALGGDTGGSVRQPAAWCRVVGYKPEQRAVPRNGLVPLAPALDTVGWFASSVDGTRLAAEVLGGAGRGASFDLHGLCLGVDDSALENCESAVAASTHDALRQLERLGVALRLAPIPGLRGRLGPIYAAELAAAWGERCAAHPEEFGDDVRAGILAGLEVPAVEYLEALRLRELARACTRLVGVDAIACATCPILPPPLGAPDDVRRAGLFTRPFNLLDWPAISVPAGDVPAGLQIAVPRGHEAVLWALASGLGHV